MSSMTAAEVWQQAQELVPNITQALIILVSGLVIIPLVQKLIYGVFRRTHMSRALRDVVRQLTGYTLYMLWFVALLYSMGFTGLAATLSGGLLLIGVGVSQAFRELLQDVISGVTMAKDRDFEVGYEVEIGGKTTGVIQAVGTRKVRMIDDKGRLHVLPNTMVEKSEWIIISRDPQKTKTKTKGKS